MLEEGIASRTLSNVADIARRRELASSGATSAVDPDWGGDCSDELNVGTGVFVAMVLTVVVLDMEEGVVGVSDSDVGGNDLTGLRVGVAVTVAAARVVEVELSPVVWERVSDGLLYSRVVEVRDARG